MADGSVVIEIKGESEGFQEELEHTKGRAESMFSGLGKTLVGMFAATKVIGAVKDLGAAVYQVGSEFESAFAQVETIMDTSQMSVKEMEGAIRDLSKETGVAASELSGTVYSAISATGDTANAVKLAGDATKLAAAGFTDTDSALSVLTTTMNAYHMSAEEAAAISDSLIMTQNLGVTTVAELSAGMGKAIAMGSAFGVNLHNLEAAYISTTKAGISTAESTTYISSMIKELGDSGSQVAKVLQSQTGQSFDQLMESGMSLGDVLGVLLESVDGDAAALQNLWSSAEAGLASSAIVGQGLDAFNQNLAAVAGSAGATQAAYEAMAATMKHKMALIKAQAQDMAVSLFKAAGPALSGLADAALAGLQALEGVFQKAKTFIEPLVEGIKAAFQRIKDAIDKTFTPEQQAAIGEFFQTLGAVLVSVPFAAFAAGVEIVTSAITMLCDIIGAVVNFFTNTLPNAVATVKETFSSLSGVFESIASAASGAVDVLKSIFEGLKGVVENVIDFIMSGLDKLLALLSHLPGEAGQFFADLRSGAEQDAEGFSGVGGKIMDSTAAGANANAGKVSDATTGAVEKAKGDSEAAAGQATAGDTLVSKITSDISGKASNVSTAATNAVQQANNNANAAASSATAGDTIISKLVSGIQAKANAAVQAAKSAADQAVNQAKVAAAKSTEAGNKLSTNMAQGAKSKQSTVSSALTSVVNGAVSAARGASSGASAVGAAISAGVAGGIRSGAAAAISAAASMARSALSAAKAALGIASPSKVFYQIGQYVVQGLVNGIRDSNRLVEECADSMARRLISQVEDLNEQIEKIEADAAERREKKEFEDYQKSLAEKQAAVDKAKAEDRQKALDDLQKLQDDWNEKQLQKQEAAQKKELESQKKALEDRRKAVEDFQKEYEDALKKIRDKQERLSDKLADTSLMTQEEASKGKKYNVLTNLDAQTKAIERYGALLDELKGRGASDSLLEEVLSMSMEDATEYMTLLRQNLGDNDEAWEEYMRAWDAKEEAAAAVAERFFADQVDAVGEEYSTRLQTEFDDLTDKSFQAGVNVVKGLINGMKTNRKTLTDTAAALGNAVKDALTESLDEHSPSRVTDEIGRLAGAGLDQGLRASALPAIQRFRREVEAEVMRLGAVISARAESAGRLPTVTREIFNNTHTVDRPVRIEGDGLTGEFIRMLNLRLKADDRRLGYAGG